MRRDQLICSQNKYLRVTKAITDNLFVLFKEKVKQIKRNVPGKEILTSFNVNYLQIEFILSQESIVTDNHYTIMKYSLALNIELMITRPCKMQITSQHIFTWPERSSCRPELICSLNKRNRLKIFAKKFLINRDILVEKIAYFAL